MVRLNESLKFVDMLTRNSSLPRHFHRNILFYFDTPFQVAGLAQKPDAINGNVRFIQIFNILLGTRLPRIGELWGTSCLQQGCSEAEGTEECQFFR